MINEITYYYISLPCRGRRVQDEGCVALYDVAQVGGEQLRRDGGGVDVRARVANGHGLEMFKLNKMCYKPLKVKLKQAG